MLIDEEFFVASLEMAQLLSASDYVKLRDVTVKFVIPQARQQTSRFNPVPFLSRLPSLQNVSIVVVCKSDRKTAQLELADFLWNMTALPVEVVTSISITGEPLYQLPDSLSSFTSLAHLQVSMDWWGKDIQDALKVTFVGMWRSFRFRSEDTPVTCPCMVGFVPLVHCFSRPCEVPYCWFLLESS